MKVLLVAPVVPPYGGMALQAQQLSALLQRDGVQVATFATNFMLPRAVRLLERVPGLRTILRSVLIWPRLRRDVAKVDVVHVMAASWWYFFLVVCPSVLVARLCGKRVVVNYRGGEADTFFRRVGPLAAPVFTFASAVTVPSEFLASLIRRRFDVPVRIVPNVLDHSLFTYRQRAAMRPRMLVTRHLEKIYDIESVLRAFQSVQQQRPDASLWIAGGGSEEARLRRLVSHWNLRDVRFLGEVAHRDLPAIYDQCDIYVNASTVDNFPGALLEASAAGLVIVTTGAGGIPFIYDHGRSAWLVETGDWRGLAAGVDHVLRNPAAALEMTSTARRVALACDWPEVRKQLFDAYGFSVELPSTSLDGARCVAG